MEQYEKDLIKAGKKNLVRGLSLIEQRQEQRAIKQLEKDGE
jgi:hypothetical protein